VTGQLPSRHKDLSSISELQKNTGQTSLLLPFILFSVSFLFTGGAKPLPQTWDKDEQAQSTNKGTAPGVGPGEAQPPLKDKAAFISGSAICSALLLGETGILW
jgi:hypothetical protein